MIFKFHKNQEDVRQCGRFRRATDCLNTTHFFDDVYERGTRGKKAQAEGQSRGRSMVEMLGVLAIIGVLSVGAIAGYQKAMFQYKLNKQLNGFTHILNTVIRLSADTPRTGTTLNYANLLSKLGEIPDGFKLASGALKDILDTTYGIIYYRNQSQRDVTYINISMENVNSKISDRSREICRNLVIPIKENAENLRSVIMRQYPIEGSYTETSLTQTTLPSAGLTEIDNMCSNCTESSKCEIIVYVSIVASAS